MSNCAVCGSEIKSPKLKTIANQVVCSLACVALLTPNKSDSCDYCKRPVWTDNYYILNNKYYCHEKCKNEIKRRSRLNEKNIRHIKQNVFPTDNMELKNSKQLREDVLKIFKDFKFERVIENNDRNKTPNIYKSNNNNTRINKINDELFIDDFNKNKNFYGRSFVINDSISNNNSNNYSFNNSKNKFKYQKTEINDNDDNNFRGKNYNHTIRNLMNNQKKNYQPNKTVVYTSNKRKSQGLNNQIFNTMRKYNNHQISTIYYTNNDSKKNKFS